MNRYLCTYVIKIKFLITGKIPKIAQELTSKDNSIMNFIQVSLDALGLLCENHKSTEVIPFMDLELVKLFLSYRMCSQSPSFRQQLVASLKKV